jgi:hypothetical protein
MSDDADYDIVIEEIEVKEVIDINLATPYLVSLADSLLSIVAEKFKRLNNAVCPCAISLIGQNLFIWDEYGVIPDIEEILKAFGMQFERITLPRLKGRAYQVSDSIFELLSLIDGFDKASETATDIFKADEEFQIALRKAVGGALTLKQTNEFDILTANAFIKEVFAAALFGRSVTARQEDTYKETYEDGRLVNRVKSETRSNEIGFRNAIGILNKVLDAYSAQHKQHMVNGTTATVESRARKMGYSVQKKQVGQAVELILVRNR